MIAVGESSLHVLVMNVCFIITVGSFLLLKMYQKWVMVS